MMRRWARTSAALAAGAFAAGMAGLAWSQQTPASSSAAAAPSPSPSLLPSTPPPPARAEEPPPPAAEVPKVVAPGPTPEAPPQEIAPAPPSATETAPAASGRPSGGTGQQAKAPAPVKRTLYNAAIMQAVDKVTAETLRFEVQVRQPVRYKGLIFTLHTCEASPPGTLPAAFAHLEIDSQPQPLPGRPPNPTKQVFKGWMMADAPGLHPLEHPVYDAWLIACKTASGPMPSARR
jgi:hypothetical protein